MRARNRVFRHRPQGLPEFPEGDDDRDDQEDNGPERNDEMRRQARRGCCRSDFTGRGISHHGNLNRCRGRGLELTGHVLDGATGPAATDPAGEGVVQFQRAGAFVAGDGDHGRQR